MSSDKFSSLFASPRLFVGLTAKDSEAAAMSPTSILETKPFSPARNPFFVEKTQKKFLPWDVDGGSGSIGLGLVDALRNEEPARTTDSPQRRMVLFGSQLKIQIPFVSMDFPQLPIEFGVKNKTTQLALLSPALMSPRVFSNVVSATESPGVLSGCLAAGEMEMSEDYTCVVTHGPNPKTTHIFDNCIIKSSVDIENKFLDDGFLTSCHACKKDLGEGRDIFVYRGESAFCSSECRDQGMLFVEGMLFVKRIQRVMNNNVMTPGNMEYVFRRIGFAIQKGLAAQLVARLPSI